MTPKPLPPSPQLSARDPDWVVTAATMQAIESAMFEAGMPVAALSPLELARWVGEKLRGAQ